MVQSESSRLDIPSRGDVIRRHRDAGGRIAGVFPIHYARALLRAFGILPVEVWGPPGYDYTESDAHLQAYTCSIVRAGLAFRLQGGLDATDLLLVPHGCDSLQGLGSVLLDFLDPGKPVLTLYAPRGEGPDAVQFLADELGAMRHHLGAITGLDPSDEELGEAIELEEMADHALAELYGARPLLPLSDRDFYQVVRAREYLPAEDFLELSETTLQLRGEQPLSGVPLLVSGVLPEPTELFDAIADAGAWIAADDFLCTGRRLYPAGDSPKPLRRMAQSLLGAPPDSTRGSTVEARAAHLIALCRARSVKAAVFYIVKFCEPEQFYLPLLRKALEQHGIRSVEIEVDISEPYPHQATTRLEALLETVA
ncbi:MAG: 2-hydroxyacyl-CoA dehydratase [Deltaproteobacteria bacterium]|jgi:benzoyl-CoA reductase/2-hydroxyglutaryl-CoA dehydratase subunit BcrC/BadD/HgdB|nr:2-hydroxyacyl-CoA dehydratase [Deltaproteobacteria bacterium]MBW2533632.1 2-hydroxyacyl-CoA dehydratase [Deltaproteobacteria bacterium]